MNNSDMPAAPTFTHDVKLDMPLHKTDKSGLTKREMFAMHAMHGYIAGRFAGGMYRLSADEVAEESVCYADALLAELEKQHD